MICRIHDSGNYKKREASPRIDELVEPSAKSISRQSIVYRHPVMHRQAIIHQKVSINQAPITVKELTINQALITNEAATINQQAITHCIGKLLLY